MNSEKPLNPPCPALGEFSFRCLHPFVRDGHVRGRSVFAMPALQRALWQMCCDGKAMRPGTAAKKTQNATVLYKNRSVC